MSINNKKPLFKFALSFLTKSRKLQFSVTKQFFHFPIFSKSTNYISHYPLKKQRIVANIK